MIRALAALLVLAGPVAALDLTLPTTARQTATRNTDPDTYAAPIGVYDNGALPMLSVEGAVRRAAWRLDSPGLTPLQVIQPLRTQLQDAGLEIALDCPAVACGGFDFRFAVETLPGPNMYVNIRAFHYITALRREGGTTLEVVTVLASTSATSAYVQIIQAGNLDGGAVAVAAVADLPVTRQPTPAAAPDAGEVTTAHLLSHGHLVLTGLEFETGSADLGAGPFETLKELAAFLNGQPSLRVALVGHTDSVGGLEGNIALSKRRAASVRQRLIESYGVDGARMDAQGMGYLSPVASNLDEAGRDQNRRVEVILLGAD